MSTIEYITTFFLTLLFIYALIRNAERLGLIDIPNERSVHKGPMPRGGGIGFILAVFVVSLIFNLSYMVEYYYLYLSIFMIFIVGIVDDKRGVSPSAKMIAIFFATCILYLNGFSITSLGYYLGYEITLPFLLILPFTFLAVAGFTNAFNLIDGLDGLAGAVGLIILTTFLIIGFLHNDTMMITLSSLFLVAVFAFLLFNWYPATIFMGDSGSLTLGFIISILGIQSLNYLSPVSVLFIVGLPLLDTLKVMTRRIQRKMSPFKADKGHIHHFIYNAKLDVRFTDKVLVSVQSAFSMIGDQLNQTDNFINLRLFGIIFYIFLQLLDQRIRYRNKTVSRKETTEQSATRQQNSL